MYICTYYQSPSKNIKSCVDSPPGLAALCLIWEFAAGVITGWLIVGGAFVFCKELKTVEWSDCDDCDCSNDVPGRITEFPVAVLLTGVGPKGSISAGVE